MSGPDFRNSPHHPAPTPDIPLDEQARHWLVYLHSGRADSADHRAANRWRHRSDQHAHAYRRAERLWGLLGALGDSAATVDPNPLPRRRRSWPLTLAAAAMLAALMIAPALLPWRVWNADLRTAVGEIRRVPLSDGSVLTLNGDSAVDLDLQGQHRRVVLRRGEALFQVAKDPTRPFLVQAGDARMRVTGTVFDVDLRADDEVRLVVAQGHVQATGRHQQQHVSANQQLHWRRGELGERSAVNAHRALAWQHGQLIFQDRPLAAVIDDLSRYHPGHLMLLGEQLRQLRVTGVFDTDHPDQALNAIAASLSINLHRFPGVVVIY
ncbi:FecR family protein [Alloalcanivorax mobilis]|uniref:FecR family protein n=1 Tax=Alloalcanivorax mobilis TaxID=2019569 RepID=UPI000C785B05|nr:FecR family protein [Alloalcanivorax mobilis]